MITKKAMSDPGPLPRKIHLPLNIPVGQHGVDLEKVATATPKVEWSFWINNHGVRIRTPDNITLYEIDMPEMTGVSWHELERSHWKGNHSYNIGPGDVRDFILTKILGHTLEEKVHNLFVSFDEFVALSSRDIQKSENIIVNHRYVVKGDHHLASVRPDKVLSDAFFALRRESLAKAAEPDPDDGVAKTVAYVET